MNNLCKTLLVVAAVFSVAGCYNDKGDKLYPAPTTTTTCDTTTVTFAHDIMPILAASCNISGGCHDVSGSATSGFNFTTYAGIQPAASAGLVVADINWVTGHNPMPKNLPKLAQCDIDKITRWVNLGALNN